MYFVLHPKLAHTHGPTCMHRGMWVMRHTFSTTIHEYCIQAIKNDAKGEQVKLIPQQQHWGVSQSSCNGHSWKSKNTFLATKSCERNGCTMMKKCYKHRLLAITIFLPEKKNIWKSSNSIVFMPFMCAETAGSA